MRILFNAFIAVVALLSIDAFAFDNKETHTQLTEVAVDNLEFNNFLVRNLNLENGINAEIKGLELFKWLREGSRLEDEPPCRASNHFHDPLEPWSDSYMSDQPWFIDWWCSAGEYPPDNIKSNITWATGFTAPGQAIETGNEWDWNHARLYYHIYLTGKDFDANTVAVTKEERDAYFAKSLQALGQVMHLIQDMAVPAHVRNDFKSHLDWVGITPQTLFRPNEWFRDRFEYYVQKNIKNWITGSVEGGDLSDKSLTNFWDADVYDKANPDPSVSLDSQIVGLAEYTNINFASRNTIFAENNPTDHEYYHPYPSRASTDVMQYLNGDSLPETVMAEDNVPDTVQYIYKTDHGETGYRFVKPTYLTQDVQTEVGYDDRLFERTFMIDENCAADYAGKLLPRAIGYSAALLNYLFRGTIEITSPVIGITAPAGSTFTNVGINKVSVLAKNTSANEEEMQGGSLKLVVKYKIDRADAYENPPSDLSNPFQYVAADLPGTQSISRTTPEKFEFDLSANPIPVNAKEVYLYLVYRGQLGDESDAVAVGFKELEIRTLEITRPDDGVYSFIASDPAITNPTVDGFENIKLYAKNISPDGQNMGGGTVQMVLKYMVADQDQFQDDAPNPVFVFHTIKKELQDISLPHNTPVLLEFDLSGTGN